MFSLAIAVSLSTPEIVDLSQSLREDKSKQMERGFGFVKNCPLQINVGNGAI